LEYQLVHSVAVHTKTLEKCDVILRVALRKILHLPHDLPNAVVHGPISDGGLGVSGQAVQVAVLKLRMLTGLRLCRSQDVVVVDALWQHNGAKHFEWCAKALGIPKENFKGKAIADHRFAAVCEMAQGMPHSFRGNLSNEFHQVDWLKNAEVTNCMRLRTNNLWTRVVQKRRGDKNGNDNCRACEQSAEVSGREQKETLAHVLGFSPSTKRLRIHRHDLVKKLHVRSLIEGAQGPL